MNNKILCYKCKYAMAIWNYAPGKGEAIDFYCNECVPRGCSCNHTHVDDEPVPAPEDYLKDLRNWKFVEGNTVWEYLDERRRELPCCEFFYDDEGYEETLDNDEYLE